MKSSNTNIFLKLFKKFFRNQLIHLVIFAVEAMEVENVAATSTSRPGRLAANSTYAATRNMKEVIDTAKAKVGAVAALNHLNMRNYRLVAEKCLKVSIVKVFMIF